MLQISLRSRSPLFSDLALLITFLILPLAGFTELAPLAAEEILPGAGVEVAEEPPPAEDLQAKLAELEQETRAEAIRSQELQAELREIRAQARKTDETVLSIQRKIDEMKKALAQAIDQVPEVVAKADEVSASKKRVFDLAQDRMKVRAKIAMQQRLENRAEQTEGATE